MKRKEIAICLIMLFCFVSHVLVKAQCTNQIFHSSGTMNISDVQVTVLPFGQHDTTTNYCPSVTQPFVIGKLYYSGGYTFRFSPAVNMVTLNLSGINNTGAHQEIVKIYVNGVHYSIPSVGTPNGCDAMAVLTPSGDITGPSNGANSGWSGTTITGQINEITILDSVVSGGPNGAILAMFFCPPNTTSVPEIINPEFSVYPVPTTGNLTVKIQGSAELEIANLQGQAILRQHLLSGVSEVDISAFDRGVYIMSITQDGKRTSKKIVRN